MGRTINLFRRFCQSPIQSLGSVEDSEPTYNSSTSLNINEDDDALDEIPDDADAITDVDEDNPICEKDLNADNYRLYTAKAAQDAIL